MVEVPGPAGSPGSEGAGAVPWGWGSSGLCRECPGGRRREAAPPVQGGRGPSGRDPGFEARRKKMLFLRVDDNFQTPIPVPGSEEKTFNRFS